MKSFLCALLLAMAPLPAVHAQLADGVPAKPGASRQHLTAADRQEIRRVITRQIRAFERDDREVAFSYSTPGIRRHFGSARSFMDMVKSDYPVLYQNRSTTFLEAAVIDGQVIQPLRIVTREGESVVALYTLERQPDRRWRIAGCEIAPSTLQVA